VSDVRRAWDRREGETSRAYAAFRAYRDMGPLRTHRELPAPFNTSAAERWSHRFEWVARAAAWDDERAMIEDDERLDALRQMHHTHQVVARSALAIAARALAQLDVAEMSASEVVRMMEAAAALERQTLTQPLSELLGQGPVGADDPWDRIASELSGA
jgi:hypothetical protein